MKHAYSRFILVLIFIFFHFDQLYAEGFVRGTLVEVPGGYAKIEDVCVGDRVISCDDQQHCGESFVAYRVQKSVDRYLRLTIADEIICVACDQQLYDEKDDVWVAAHKLCDKYTFAGHKVDVELVDAPLDVYSLAVAQHHNFLVSKAHICAHNFFPPIVLAISLAFGSGSLEIAGISAGIAGLGGFLGYQWHKKKQKHAFVIQPQFYGGGMMPEDPEEEKKQKRDQAREEHRPLTNKEAQEIAEQCGHRKVQSHPCGNTRNKPVFFNGKNYISPDADGHNGGLWKVFDRRGKILHTASRRFEKIVKIYE